MRFHNAFGVVADPIDVFEVRTLRMVASLLGINGGVLKIVMFFINVS